MAYAKAPVQKPAAETVAGTIKRLTYHNEENGYFVAQVTIGVKERTVTGYAPVITEGEHLEAEGAWTSSQYGTQFKASNVKLSIPTMGEGIVKYLSTAIEGVGPSFAQKLFNHFGEDIFDVLENAPERLSEIKGLGKKRAQACVEGYMSKKASREAMVFLRQIGLSRHRAQRIYDEYGNDIVDKLKKNPYFLCNIWGIGFTTADDSARRQGILKDSEYRVRAGIIHVLKEASGQGSCGLPISKVLEHASKLLGVSYDRIEECIALEVEAEGLVRATAAGLDCVFLPQIYVAEKNIARILLSQAARPIARPVKDIDQAILHAELTSGINLEKSQRMAVIMALTNQVCVITGGPGTGKSTITRLILEVLSDEGLDIALCAPTGKAAKRASEATGFEAKTLHRTLELDNKGQFKRTEDNPLDADVLVIDELSMVDVRMCYSVLRAVAPHTRIILIGDVDQLPSVDPGKVLADILDSEVLPTVRLTEVFRQAANSDIIKNAHRVNNGEVPFVGWNEGSDFCFNAFAPENDSDAAKDRCRDEIEAEVLRLAQNMYRMGYDPIRDVQVLAPMRRGQLGSLSLNLKLRDVLNPDPPAKLTYGDATYGVGDKVMQLRNNYEKQVFNGDIGYVESVDEKTFTVVVEYEGRDSVTYKADELNEITLAYAFTIHKSQGSEFPVVIMPLDMSHFMMLKRNLVYTGITRAKKLMALVGQKKAAATAVKNRQIDERYSRLCEWLRAGAKART